MSGPDSKVDGAGSASFDAFKKLLHALNEANAEADNLEREVAAKSREASMAASVAALAKRARGVEESIRERVERGGGAGAVEAESFALEIDDPLLKKFEELERD